MSGETFITGPRELESQTQTCTQSPPIPTQEMVRLHTLDFSLVPLGGGQDGKSPLLSFGQTPRIPLKRVLAPMHRTGSACYGIRLDGLVVIDCDENEPSLVAMMEARFGEAFVHVKTPRGVHLYYRVTDGHFPNLRKEGFPVDIKNRASEYVVGPGSERPDGGTYSKIKGVLGETVLSKIKVRSAVSASAPEGRRNTMLTNTAIQMVEFVDSEKELVSNLRFARDEECENAETISDNELHKIAQWAWSIRLKGTVYHARNSEFRVDRAALDALRRLPHSSDAIALLVCLLDQHSHRPAVIFPLCQSAMKTSGITDLSRRRFLGARRVLEQVGILKVAKKHSAGTSPRLYQLVRVRVRPGGKSNIRDLS